MNADKNNVDHYIEKFDEDITKFTPEFEYYRYRDYIFFICQEKKDMKNIQQRYI